MLLIFFINFTKFHLKVFCVVPMKKVRVTNLEDASEHIGEVLSRVKKEHLKRAYKVSDWYDFFYYFLLFAKEQLYFLVRSYLYFSKEMRF